jgi:tryptophanyl-tRNA synthetase
MRRSDPGNPDICNVFSFHKLYSEGATVQAINRDCRKAQIGCVECKHKMAASLNLALEPIRENRHHYETHPERVEAIIAEGTHKATTVARQTMHEVRTVLKLETPTH